MLTPKPGLAWLRILCGFGIDEGIADAFFIQ